MRAWRAGLTVVLLWALAAAPALAKTWRIDPSRSVIAFDYTEDGATGQGRFGRFSGGGTFDPSAPGSATMAIDIAVETIRLSDSFRTGFVLSEAWFHVDRHPQVRYRLLSLTPLGPDRWRASGALTIKGVTREIETELMLRLEGDEARASGSVRFDRLDFRLGDTMSLFVDIGRDVSVRFELVGAAE